MEPVVHVIEIALTPAIPDDAIGLPAALARLREDDPALAYYADRDSPAFVLKATSEAHLEGAIDRLLRDFGIRMTLGAPQVAFRETITKTVEYDYTHKKLPGAAGQFARVKILFEPTARGSGFAFENAVIGGSVPREVVAGVEKGLRSALDTGVYAGYPTIDFKASLIDGAYHDVDSNVMTFEIASRACFREGMAKAGPRLLEPIMRVEVVTPEEHMGEVIGDLNSRRGWITGRDQRGDARVIDARVPFQEMLGYANRLASMTGGRAEFSLQFDHYAPIRNLDPPHPGAAIGLRLA